MMHHPLRRHGQDRTVLAPVGHLPFPAAVTDQVGLNPRQRLGKLRVQQDMTDVAQGLVLGKSVHLFGSAVPIDDPILGRAHQDGSQVQQLGLLAQHAFALPELLVARRQFLVERGQLFVGRFELLVGRLQLLVEALQFLVGGLHLFVRGLEFFHRDVVGALQYFQAILQRHFLLHRGGLDFSRGDHGQRQRCRRQQRGQFAADPARRIQPAVDLVRPFHRLEQTGMLPHRFGGAQKQITGRAQRVVERGNQLLLHSRFDVDHHVAAADEIDFRERRLAQEILLRENEPVAQRFIDPELVALGGKVRF
jgi:hypothetical protein